MKLIRPHLIVGLGGAGQKVVADVRQRIVSQYGDLEAIPWMRFSVIDYRSELRDDRAGNPPNLQWRPHDWVGLDLTFDGLVEIAQDLGSTPHLAKWIPPSVLSQDHSLARGATPIRALGRLAYFQSYKAIRDALLRSVSELSSMRVKESLVRSNVQFRNGITCWVVGSLFGGTGSGMFIDIAYTLQRVLQSNGGSMRNNDNAVNGIFLMPPLDTVGTSAFLNANAYAALIELDHFSRTETEFTAQYLPDDPVFRTKEAPFSMCYLLEPKAGKSGADAMEACSKTAGARIFLESTTEFGMRKEEFRANIRCAVRADIPRCNGTFGVSLLDYPRATLRQEYSLRLMQTAVKQWLGKPQSMDARAVETLARQALREVGLGAEDLLNRIRAGDPDRSVNSSVEARMADWLKESSTQARMQRPVDLLVFLRTQTEGLRHNLKYAADSHRVVELESQVPVVSRESIDRIRDRLRNAFCEGHLDCENAPRYLAMLSMYLEESQRRLGQEPQSLVSAADEERRALEYVQAAVSRPFACWLWRRKAIDRAIEAYLDLVAANSIKLDETLAASQAVIVLQSVMKDLHALEREIDLGISMLEKIRSELEREEQRRSHGQNLPILDMPGFQQLKDELLRTASAETLIGEFGWQTKDELYESIFASHEQERVLEGLVASAARLFDGQNLPSPMDLFLRQQTPEQLALLFNQLATMAQPQMRWRFPQHHESLPMPVEASCWAGVPQSINEQRGFVEAIQQMLHDQLDAGFRHQVTVISLSDPDRVAVLRDCEGFSLPVVAAVHACKADYKKSLLSKNDFHPHTRTDVEWQPILAETESPASARRPESIRSVAELRVRDCLLKVSVDDIVEMDVNSIVCSRSRTLEPGTASTRSVHGAIQQAGGGGIDQEAIRGGPIEHGAIIVTQAGALRADHVIHAGIIDDLTNQRVTQTVIARAVRASLNECEKREWTSIALPLMGTRVGGISQDKCVEVMLDEVYSHAAQGRAFPKVVVFCLQGFVGLARLVEKLTVLRERAAQIPARQDQSLVFISAKSEDYEYAEELFEYLVAVGVPTFFSKESLPKLGDADYRREIDRALEAAEHMVVVTTCRRHLESPWVEAEWGFFINEKRSGRKNGNLVTLTVGTLQPQELPPSLRYYEAIPSGPDAFTRIFQYIN